MKSSSITTEIRSYNASQHQGKKFRDKLPIIKQRMKHDIYSKILRKLHKTEKKKDDEVEKGRN